MTTSYRFVAVGDLHLVAGPRNADRLAALDYVIGDAALNPVDAWLWPGDLTHVGMTIELRNLLAERTIRMAAGAPVVIVPGNHDPEGDLDFLARLRTVWPVHVSRKPEVVDCAVRSGLHVDFGKDAAFALFCLPYPSKGMLVAAGTPHEGIVATADRALDLLFMQAGADLAAAREAGRLTGAIGHANIAGSVSSVGQPQIGQEIEVTAQHLARLGPCFKVFNHIHKHQRVADGVYPGSLCRLDWGEVEPKGYLAIECVRREENAAPVALGGGLSAHPRMAWWGHAETFVAVPVAPMYHVEGRLSREGFDWQVTKGPGGPKDDPPPALIDGDGPDWTGCDVRVRASYLQSERDVLVDARECVKRTFACARRFEFEPVAVLERPLRAPEVVAARTLGGKLLAWARLTDTAWSEEIVRCADLLQQTEDGDAVVAEVEARLAPLADVTVLEPV